jgi:hypothetical protein
VAARFQRGFGLANDKDRHLRAMNGFRVARILIGVYSGLNSSSLRSRNPCGQYSATKSDEFYSIA